ncbi:MAG: hypothetical protein KDC38_21240, partial [Planctomycetes bacterium]|nr:hypothetical protein [Planctomycetota bacterium]
MSDAKLPRPIDRTTVHVGSTSVSGRADGVALIMVILVLTALVVIGTPFVISMKLQEEGGRQIAAQERARLAQVSARNHAVAHLFGTYPSRESGTVEISMNVEGENAGRAAEHGDTELPGRKMDDREEIDVLIDPTLAVTATAWVGSADEKERVSRAKEQIGTASQYVMQDPKGRILDVSVEDEQGKVNLNTATPVLLGNLFAGSHLAEDLGYEAKGDEIALEDTEPFPADNDPETVDGIVVIFNPRLFTMEAVSYRGKTETHLTGCFRGEYLSGTWPAEAGFPVFDLRGMKLFLHRIQNIGEGTLRTYRTPASAREIAEWSMIPYFAKTLALFGLNVRNMDEYGLTPQMLNRAGLQDLLNEALVREGEVEVDPKAYRDARAALEDLGIPKEALDLLEGARGKSGVVSAGEYAKKFELSRREGLQIASGFESVVKAELQKIKRETQRYFPKAIESFKAIHELPGLETITARDFHRLRPLITTVSSRPAEWTEEQQVLGAIENNPLLGV